MDFDESLNLALEAIPKWRQMRLQRKRREADTALAQPVQQPARTSDVVRLPEQYSSVFQKYKSELMRSLGVIAHLIPELKPDVQTAMDMLFRNVTTNFHFAEAAGESWEVLQQEWLNVLRQIENINRLIPKDKQYAPMRVDLRKIRDFLRGTIGKELVRKPVGALPQQFSTS